MPLRDEYGEQLDTAGDVTEEPGGYADAVDQEAAEEAYQAEVGLRREVETIRDQYYVWAQERLPHIGVTIDEEGTYQVAVESLQKEDFDPSPEAVERYCERYTTASWDGLFLSALCNESSHDTFTLSNMDTVSYLGYRNEKDVTVEGSVGARAGLRMQDGTLTVQGDADEELGARMDGGVIELHGEGDIAAEDDSRIENVGGVQRIVPAGTIVPSNEPEGLVERVLDALEGM